jgi:Zn-dependent protease
VTRQFGWQPEIVLYFFGGYATSMRHSTWKDIAVSAAGPLAGLSLFAVLFFGGPWALRRFDVQHELLWDALGFSLLINMMWNVMNLLPVLPLDGGQISRELLTWFNPRKGLEQSLMLSMLASGGVVLWALRARSQGAGVLGLDPLFLAIMFGFLCFQSYQAWDAHRRGYW